MSAHTIAATYVWFTDPLGCLSAQAWSVLRQNAESMLPHVANADDRVVRTQKMGDKRAANVPS